jgi:D-alanyl-D-alanine dipeptidase
LFVGVLMALTVGAILLGGLGAGVGRQADLQRAADLAALAGARAMLEAYPRLFEPAIIDGEANRRHLAVADYRGIGSRVAEEVARRNGAARTVAAFPDAGSFAPVRLRVRVDGGIGLGDAHAPLTATAEAELAPGDLTTTSGGGYAGPLAHRQGKPMRPDVAVAFDRMERAARADGVALIIASGYRSDAEQARLFAARPDPRWVARPGTSLHRLGTELDLGPAAAYGRLKANATRFGFIRRYSWALCTKRSGSRRRHLLWGSSSRQVPDAKGQVKALHRRARTRARTSSSPANEEAADEAVTQGGGSLSSASRSAAREVMSSFGKTR